MAKNEPIRRYFYEIEHIRKADTPSLKDLLYYLENREILVSERTIERDIEQIRRNFGIEVNYDPQNRGYFIDEEMSPNLHSFIRFLEIANTTQLFLSGINQTKDFMEDIEFDLLGGLMGTENLGPLLEAIKKQITIKFSHFNYSTEKKTEVVFNPYFLKEYLGRWYVIGMRNDNKTRTYGIDRISNLELTTDTFTKINNNKIKENFSNIIGVVYSYNEQQEVILSFTPQQGRYVKSLPWHHSQKVLIDNEEELRISLFVVPNYELLQKILMNGADVVVMEPEWLRDEIKEKITNALKRYKKDYEE